MDKKTTFTTDFIKDIVEDFFNGEENNEEIVLKDAYSGEEKTTDMATYLNIDFFAWQKKVDSTETDLETDIDDWLSSIDYAMDKAYARVSLEDESCTSSNDIDNGEITANIEFLIQLDKTTNLDYYVRKIRNRYMGEPIEIQNAYGKKIKAYILLGITTEPEEPFNCQLGYCTIVNVGLKISYMESALGYIDYSVKFSLDEGKNFYDIPLNKETWRALSESDPVSLFGRPDRTGFSIKTFAAAKTFSFFDYNRAFNKQLNELLFGLSAYSKNHKLSQLDKNLQHRIITKIVDSSSNVYEYCDIIDTIEKEVDNGQFNICSISLKTASRQPFLANTKYWVPIQSGNFEEFTKTPVSYDKMVEGDLSVGTVHAMLGSKSTNEQVLSIKKDSKCRYCLYIKAEKDCKVKFKTVISVPTATGNYEVIKYHVVELSKDKINYVELESDYTNTRVGWEKEDLPQGSVITYEMRGELLEVEDKTTHCFVDVVSNDEMSSCIELFY